MSVDIWTKSRGNIGQGPSLKLEYTTDTEKEKFVGKIIEGLVTGETIHTATIHAEFFLNSEGRQGIRPIRGNASFHFSVTGEDDEEAIRSLAEILVTLKSNEVVVIE